MHIALKTWGLSVLTESCWVLPWFLNVSHAACCRQPWLDSHSGCLWRCLWWWLGHGLHSARKEGSRSRSAGHPSPGGIWVGSCWTVGPEFQVFDMFWRFWRCGTYWKILEHIRKYWKLANDCPHFVLDLGVAWQVLFYPWVDVRRQFWLLTFVLMTCLKILKMPLTYYSGGVSYSEDLQNDESLGCFELAHGLKCKKQKGTLAENPWKTLVDLDPDSDGKPLEADEPIHAELPRRQWPSHTDAGGLGLCQWGIAMSRQCDQTANVIVTGFFLCLQGCRKYATM